jgi:acyl dehydratase
MANSLVAFLGINKVRFIKPVMPGDIIRFECEVTAKKETKKTDRGVIKFKNIGKNQDGETILDAEVTFMIRRKE